MGIVTVLIAPVIGGLIGALSSLYLAKVTSRRSLRIKALEALWAYQLALNDLAISFLAHHLEAQSLVVDEHPSEVLKRIGTARLRAAPYGSYLSNEQRTRILDAPVLDVDDYGELPPDERYDLSGNSVSVLAAELRQILESHPKFRGIW